MNDVKINHGYIVLISTVAAFGGLLFGFDTAVISGVVPYIEKLWSLNGIEIGWSVSSLIIGCIVGVIFAGIFADKYGRKKILLITSLLFLVSAIGTAFSGSFLIFVIFRVIGGLGVGIASMVSPMYIAEIAPPAKRGQLVSINQLTVVTGILIAFTSNWLLSSFGDESWRYMLLIMGVPSILFFVLLFVVPESPRWLIQVGRTTEAKKIMTKISGEATALEEIQSIEQSIKSDSKIQTVKIGELFAGKMKKLILIGILLAAFQQITGINVIMYYAPKIFAGSGVSIESALWQTIMIGAINLTFTVVAILFIDRVGRKPLLIFGSLTMMVSLFLLALTFYIDFGADIWALIFILVFIAGFAISLGPVTWVLISELFPNRLRGKAMSVSIMFLWIALFLVSLFFPIMFDANQGLTFLLLAGICFLAFLFYLKYVTETKGKRLEDM